MIGKETFEMGAGMFLAVCLAVFNCAGVAEARVLVLKNATVVNPDNRTTSKRNIFIVDGKISSDQPPKSAGSVEELDLTGKWVIPGLIDLHVHCGGNPFPTGKYEQLGPVETSRRMLYAGVVAFLDCATGEPDKFFAVRDRQRQDPQKSSDEADLYGAGTAFGRWNAGSPAEFPQRIQSYIARYKPDIIKFIYGRNSLSGDCLKAGLQAARKAGVKSVVHIGSWEHARDAIEGGATVVTHLFDDEVIPDDLVRTWVAHKTISVPTMAVQCDMARFADTPTLLQVAFLEKMEASDLLHSYLDKKHYSEQTLDTLNWQREDINNDMKSFHKLAKAGVVLLAGSDTNNTGTIQGFSLHREMQLMHEGGYSNWQSLAAATTGAAAFLGRPSGINTGDTAEMVILSADPTVRISNTQQIWGVIHHGVQVDRQALLGKAQLR